MKKYILFLWVILFAMPLSFVSAEQITSIDVLANINEDATINVQEKIHYDFGDAQKHGIYRDIPIAYVNAMNDKRTIRITDVSVSDLSGTQYTFTTSRNGDDLRIKIGDANAYVTGEKVYAISYTITGAINYFDDHDEFYWNAIGDRWEVPIDVVRVMIHAPQIDQTTCYVGIYGSTTACDETTKLDADDVSFMHSNIAPGSGMTVVIGIPTGAVYKPTILQKIMQYIKDNWVLLVPIVVFLGMWRMWYVKGRDPQGKGTIVPYYDAPEGLTAAEVGMMAQESVTPKSISAAIIQLAVNGYLTIKKIDKEGIFSSDDYEFIRTEKDYSDLNEQDMLLYDAIFSKTQSRKMSALKEKFYKDLEKIKTSVESSIMQKGYYTKNPATERVFYIAVSVMLFLGSFFIGGVAGFAYGVATFFSALPVLGFGVLMPQRTQRGSIVREEILGLKLYMETAEKDRINFHNAPEKRPERFEKLLPYAMVLGVEEQWAKQFEDIYKSSPEWYQSSNPSFSPVMFAHSMHAFSDANNSTITSKPSSAGSGGSGFSGGGSGGGFGGGGGGSW
jgi:uncharacterized membrane protein